MKYQISFGHFLGPLVFHKIEGELYNIFLKFLFKIEYILIDTLQSLENLFDAADHWMVRPRQRTYH
jgi:hypothetical protein